MRNRNARGMQVLSWISNLEREAGTSGESWESTFAVIQHTLAPCLIGADPSRFEFIHEIMDQAIYGVPTAKAAIDIACFDAVGKAFGVPAYNLLGGRFHKKFPITHVLSIASPEHMAQEAADRVEEGYGSLKMKVGTNVAEDVKRIQAVRERAKTATPMMIDEGLHGVRDMREIIAKRAADKVNIKLMKCGGMYPAMKLAQMAEMAGIECQVDSMVESSVGSAAGFHVAFSKKVMTSVELTGPLKFSKDIGNLRYDVPFIQLSEQPGLGVDVDEEVLMELTVRKEKVTR